MLSEFKKAGPFLLMMLLIGAAIRKITVKGSSGVDRFLKIGKVTPVDGKDLKVKIININQI